MNLLLVRSLSSQTSSLRRPPKRNDKQRRKQDNSKTLSISRPVKLRTHAVSLGFGDYSDRYSNINENNGDWMAIDNDQAWQEEEENMSQKVKEAQAADDLKKQKWLENAKPPVRGPIIDDRGRSFGHGGRKAAKARVWIQPGFGIVTINHLDIVDYFERYTDREMILSPLAATETCGKFDIHGLVYGGGLTGQAGALRLAIARALNHYNPDSYRPPLKHLGYLTRDARKVERKKVGRVKARKSPQWVRR